MVAVPEAPPPPSAGVELLAQPSPTASAATLSPCAHTDTTSTPQESNGAAAIASAAEAPQREAPLMVHSPYSSDGMCAVLRRTLSFLF